MRGTDDHNDTDGEAVRDALFEQLPAALLLVEPDAPDFTVRDVNAAYRRLAGRTRAQMVGRPLSEAFRPNPGGDGQASLRQSFDRVLATRAEDHLPVRKYEGPNADGETEVRWWRATNRPLLDEGGAVAAIIHQAEVVTDRVETEAGLRESEARLRFIADLDEKLNRIHDAADAMTSATTLLGQRLGASRCAYADVDDDNDRFNIRQDYNAPGIESSTGTYSLDLFGPRAAADMRQGRTLVVRDVASELEPESGRDMFQAIGINAIICCPLVKDDRLAAMMAVHQDRPRDWTADEIALVEAVVERCWAHVERVGAEARLRESESKFHAIANSIDQMVWSTQPDGFHDYYNDRWYEYTGVPPGSTDGEAWNGMFHPDDQERAWAVWRQCLATGEPYHIEYRLRHRSGDYRWVIGRAQPVRDEQGRITRWHGTCTDINELVEAREVLARSREELERLIGERTEELERAHGQLRQAQKMEAIGQLTGGIAHDFNNLLTPIVGALDIVRTKPLDERSKRLIDGAMASAERSRTLITRLLSFARRQRLESRDIHAGRLLAGLTELMTRSVDPSVRVDVRTPSPDVVVCVDPNQLELALLNLVVNSRDAMPDGGTITVSAEAEALGEDNSAMVPPGDYVRFSVVDDGEGMAEETLAQAIEPFYSTKEQGRGSGLGLSMVHGLALQSGGGLALASRPGEGTRVDLWLPVGHGEPEPDAVEDAPQPALRPMTILLVDDEDLVRAATADMLAEAGHRVDQAHGGGSAVTMFEGDPDAYDIVITDYAMPIMSGAALIRQIRAIRPDTPALLITGYASASVDVPPDVPRIAKPFRAADLLHRVEDIARAAEARKTRGPTPSG